MEFNEFFVQGMALLGAGIAMVAGLGQGIGQGLLQVKVLRVLLEIQKLPARFSQSWFLVLP